MKGSRAQRCEDTCCNVMKSPLINRKAKGKTRCAALGWRRCRKAMGSAGRPGAVSHEQGGGSGWWVKDWTVILRCPSHLHGNSLTSALSTHRVNVVLFSFPASSDTALQQTTHSTLCSIYLPETERLCKALFSFQTYHGDAVSIFAS